MRSRPRFQAPVRWIAATTGHDRQAEQDTQPTAAAYPLSSARPPSSSPTEATRRVRRVPGLAIDVVRERYKAVRAEAGPGVTVVAATKYVSIGDMAVLADAGVEVVGENRVQDLLAKHASFASVFRWHFIGHLQSRKVKAVNETCELVHSLASESAARRLAVPALVEVNLSGEPTKSGVAPEELERVLGLYHDVRGLMTMPPLADDPEQSRPYFRRLRELADAYGLRELSMGTSQDWRVAVDEGATLVRLGRVLYGE
ncbi:MAG: YggS family pyridoxal phosphate enzyme [Thermoleophilia bacterium]|nr:YggS family pyridoxal phosphate enzyme [Thermoleophilia bacterium]